MCITVCMCVCVFFSFYNATATAWYWAQEPVWWERPLVWCSAITLEDDESLLRWWCKLARGWELLSSAYFTRKRLGKLLHILYNPPHTYNYDNVSDKNIQLRWVTAAIIYHPKPRMNHRIKLDPSYFGHGIFYFLFSFFYFFFLNIIHSINWI